MKQWLKFVEKVILVFLGVCLGGYAAAHKYCMRIKDLKTELSRWQFGVRLYDIWIMTKQYSQSIADYLSNKEIKNIAIYGASFLGTRLYYELKETDINVKYILDKNTNISLVGVDMRDPDHSSYKGIDAVIVTTLYSYDEIKNSLKSRGCRQIFALDEILYDLMIRAQSVESKRLGSGK